MQEEPAPSTESILLYEVINQNRDFWYLLPQINREEIMISFKNFGYSSFIAAETQEGEFSIYEFYSILNSPAGLRIAN